ncbi:MAG: hypothetical protein FJZ01_00675, partial [Candidatus Sericytochromatia bacterium]|nr:hypothetical protein [Candidatus Tanganyikabacteria bacterium]
PAGGDDGGRPAALGAACVHAGPYGTRSSTLLRLPASGPPELRYTAGPPCTHPPLSADPFWSAG